MTSTEEGSRKSRKSLTRLFTRDRLLFGLGAAGVAWETVVQQGERPTLLILFAACLGFPVFLAADERKNGSAESKNTVASEKGEEK